MNTWLASINVIDCSLLVDIKLYLSLTKGKNVGYPKAHSLKIIIYTPAFPV